MLKPAQKIKRPTIVVTHRRKTAVAATDVSSGGSGWLRWLLLLVAATGLMMVSFASLVGAARAPAGARPGMLAFRRPRREPIREVLAERIEAPLPLAAAIVAPAPPREVQPAPARSAPVFVPEPTPKPEIDAAAPVTPVEDDGDWVDTEVVPEPTEEACEILVWRGYAKARFYARLDVGETDEFAVAESPSFRFHGNGTPADTESARAAHRALVEKLRAKGWEEEDTSGPWYAARFRRPLERTPT